jgi:chloramphenicol-sensitive protein RarD
MLDPEQHRAELRRGVIAAVLAYTFWGFFPIYFIVLRGVASDEILAHRILFAVPVGAAIIWARRQWPEVRAGLASRKVVGILTLSASVIALNWLVYIIAVQSQRIFEASLGYYINPLMYVLAGVVLLNEKLRPAQTIAVALAAIGVLILTIYGGRFPTISLVLATSFTIYGLLRKRVGIGAMPGLFIETALLAPLALAYLLFVIGWTGSAFGTGLAAGDMRLVALLAFAGPATVLPLLFFALAARRLTLATLGFLQFIGPTLQFLIGIIDGESFTRAHQLCFAFIWVAAAVFAFDAWRQRPRRPQPARQVGQTTARL